MSRGKDAFERNGHRLVDLSGYLQHAAMRGSGRTNRRVQYYLDVENALALVQGAWASSRIAPPEIVKHCTVAEIDFERAEKATERVGFPIMPVVQQLTAFAPTVSASGVIGARRRKTSRTRQPFCRCAPGSN